MTVKEWIDRHGLTLESEMPEGVSINPLESYNLEGLTSEQRQSVSVMVRDCVCKEDVQRYIGWLRSGDCMYRTSGNCGVADVLSIIMKDVKVIERADGMTPVIPLEFIVFHYHETTTVGVRFTKKRNDQ